MTEMEDEFPAQKLSPFLRLSVLISKMGNLPQMPFFNIFYTDSTKHGEHFDV